MEKQAELKALLPVKAQATPDVSQGYGLLLSEISGLLDQARRTSARTFNSILTATYWEIGWRIIEFEQGGRARAEYGEGLLKRLATDLAGKYRRGFSRTNLQQMRMFYLDWKICQTASGKLEARAAIPAAIEKKGQESTGKLIEQKAIMPGASPSPGPITSI